MLTPPAERQHNFEQAVAFAINLWPDLTLAVQNGWGGDESADKRDFLAGAIVGLFPEYTDGQKAEDAKKAADAEPDVQDVESVLLDYLMEEFQVNIDDDSSAEVAVQILRARAQTYLGQTDELDTLRDRYNNRKGKGVDMFKKVDDQDQDTDWESDDDDEDDDNEVTMDEAPQLVRKPKEEPEVDEDGFTTVKRR